MAGLRIGMDGSRGEPFEFQFDGKPYRAYPGETVAVALWANGVRSLRTSPGTDQDRGAFCFMGSCQECVISVGGRLREACRTPAAPGLIVERIGRLGE